MPLYANMEWLVLLTATRHPVGANQTFPGVLHPSRGLLMEI